MLVLLALDSQAQYSITNSTVRKALVIYKMDDHANAYFKS